MFVKTDKYGYITNIDKEKEQGDVEVNPIPEWMPYMANFANKFRVDNNGIMHAPDNLPVSQLDQRFDKVNTQLSSADTEINALKKSDNASAVNSLNAANAAMRSELNATNAKLSSADAQAAKADNLEGNLTMQIVQLKQQLASRPNK